VSRSVHPCPLPYARHPPSPSVTVSCGCTTAPIPSQPCPPSLSVPSHLPCLFCPGQFGATVALTSSTCSGSCTAGFFCPAGSTSAVGAPNGGQCVAGTFSVAGQASCTQCAAGQFGSAVRLTSSACSGSCTVSAVLLAAHCWLLAAPPFADSQLPTWGSEYPARSAVSHPSLVCVWRGLGCLLCCRRAISVPRGPPPPLVRPRGASAPLGSTPWRLQARASCAPGAPTAPRQA
jgi:hypothetical protein